VSAENLAVAEAFYASHLTNRIRQNRLAGYSSTWATWADVPLPLVSAACSWPRWRGVDLPLRMAVFKVTDVMLAALGPGTIPESLDRDVLRVQVCHELRQRDIPPLEAARRALALAAAIPRPEDPRELQRWAYSGPSDDPAVSSWSRIFIGAAYVPGWDVMVRAWDAPTAGVREMLGRVVGPPPAALDSPGAFAWLDWAAGHPAPILPQRVAALRGLTPEEGERIATVAIEQHEAWMARDLVRRLGSSPDIAKVAPDVLHELRTYHGTHSTDLEARVRAAGVHINAVKLDPAAAADEGDDEDEPYFPGGFVLLPQSEVDEPSPAVRAGHGEWLRVKKLDEPLLIVLDLDLTRPELAFLGLEGTRLVFCDWATGGRKTCYTRVGLDGSVKLMRRTIGDADDSPPEPGEPLVLGPAFGSPVLDMPHYASAHHGPRIGGRPAWEQYPEVPKSPDNRCPMTFVAQFPHPNGGTGYAFLDPLNLIAAVVTQYD
jgi:hypothetical protein